MEVLFLFLVVVVVIAVVLLKGFDQIAGRGPKQVSDGIRQSGLGQGSKPSATPSVADEIAKLAELRQSGTLTQEEFEAQKAKLLR